MRAIAFVDLAAQRRRLGDRIERALARVLEHGAFIMGPEVRQLEADLSAFCGARHSLCCSSGTDALVLPLMAKGIGPGDAVFCPAFTFAATAEAVAWLGAAPVFTDVLPDTFTMDPTSLEAAIDTARRAGLTPRAVIPVDLFGLPADYDAIQAVCEREGLWILADSAQAFGAKHKGRRTGTLGLATATSFFPAKPLGCYGDGGAVFTDDDMLAEVMTSLRVHGQGTHKYDNVRVGLNARLDTLQAAILIEKLGIYEEELVARDAVAARYAAGLYDVLRVPVVPPGFTSTWAQYTVRVTGAGRRDRLARRLKERGVPTAIYYPKPLHRQDAYRHHPVPGDGLPVSDQLANEVLSLPMHAYLDEVTQDRIVAAVRECCSA